MRHLPILVGLLVLQFGAGSLDAQILGPSQLPTQLSGLWQVSLCTSCTHAWIRFQHTTTGEVHTLGRYTRGFGGVIDWRTCQRQWPAAPASGVIWDQDLKFEWLLRSDMHTLRSCHVWNPCIFHGQNDGYGHCGLRMNCTSHARDAWHYYSGEWYDLPPLELPCAIEKAVWGQR